MSSFLWFVLELCIHKEGFIESMHICATGFGCCQQLEEMDYDARLGAYRRLTTPQWRHLPACGTTALLLRSLRDLRDGSDLAIRHAASQALQAFICTLSVPCESFEIIHAPCLYAHGIIDADERSADSALQ